ncbi:hypothetical protein V1477_007127 [Vespula maculifrons]|uniref:Uncharacterized protein n=1 Tax=Vespula maculifrons TaxID=7453 RepID=A0ABD2CHP7_VESMC
MPFRFGSFKLLSKLEMYKTPLTDCSTVHTVGFRHIETRPVVSTFRFQKSKRSPRKWVKEEEKRIEEKEKKKKEKRSRKEKEKKSTERCRDGSPPKGPHPRAPPKGPTQDIDFDISQVLPTQVPPRGGSCIWGPTG